MDWSKLIGLGIGGVFNSISNIVGLLQQHFSPKLILYLKLFLSECSQIESNCSLEIHFMQYISN